MLNQDQRLHIDSGDGSEAREYRINSGIVQVRTVAADGSKSVWRTLTRDKLSRHVERNTVGAQWLEHRMGWRQLLLACVGEKIASKSRTDTYQAA
jgi:hypothetical protein